MMKSRLSRCLLLCLAGCLVASGLPANRSRASNPEKGLKDTRNKIGAEKNALRDLEKKGRTLLAALESLDKDIVIAERERRVSEARMAELAKEKKSLKLELEALEGKIKQEKDEQIRRVAAYYRLGKTGMLPLLFSDASASKKFRDLDSFKRLLVSDWERLEAFHALLKEKEGLEAALEGRLQAEAVLLKTLEERKKALETGRQEKQALLLRIEKDKSLHERLLKELRQAEKELIRRMREAPPATFLPAKGALAAQKGNLPWPVAGRVHRRFGISGSVRSKGIDIRAEPGAPVRAVWSGGVAFADWFRGYGKLMIIDHGGQNFTVSAHLSELAKTKGDRVEAGEVVGRAGETGSVDGCVVHFEIWFQGRPEDPLVWLRAGGG
jgi:septal ring factor EnvC (AmiA/AmiB activator)